MDVAGIVRDTITIVLQLAAVVHDAKGTRDELEGLHADIRGLETALKLCEGLVKGDAELGEAFRDLAGDAKATVVALRKTIQPYEKAVAAKTLSKDKWRLFFKYLDQDGIKQYQGTLRHYTVVINGVCGIKTSRTVSDIAKILEGIHSSLSGLATPMQESEFRLFTKLVEAQDAKTEAIVSTLNEISHRIMAVHPKGPPPIQRKPTIKPETHQAGYPRHTLEGFLSSLEVDNGYRRAYKRVPEAEPDTCQWILQQSAYTAWLSGSGSATFLLHGQMGCGKSVLTKHLLTHIRGSKTSDPPSENDEAAVLYHFCGSVSHNADTLESASNILRAMIYHFLVRRPSLFPTITEHTDVLDDYPPARTGSTLTSNQLSLSSLWTVLTTLLAASRHSSIYCFIDAIDECDPESIGTLLQLYRRSCRTELAAGTSVKFFISSRDGATETGLFDTMRGFPRFHHLEVKPVFVGPDLKVVVERSLSRMEWLAWSSGQRSQAQSLLTEKAEGMFLWAQTAITLIQDFADALPFASALELIDDMPRQMENLYRHALRRLFESLDKKVVQSVRKVLGWLLHVVRPLSVAELSLALAIDPAERTLAKFPDRLIDAGRFVQKYLSPFVVLVPPESKAPSQNSPVPDNAPDFTAKDPRMIVGIVHQTAQDFLRKVFSGELDEPCFTALRIAKSTCHEELARICLGYLCCEELQLGWINDDKINEWGQVAVDETTKALLVTRLSQHALLGYAAVHWPSHLVHCEDRGPDDAYGLALDFLLNHHGSVACSEQVRQYIKKPELDWYWVISAPLHKAAQIDSLTLCRRILEGGLADINSTNNSGDTPLIVACAHKVNTELPDICVKIGSLLLDHGADSSLRDKFERTAMHYAAANGQVGLLNLLLRGSGHGSIEAKDDEGETPLHDAVDFDHLEATEILLNAGSDIDSTDCEGCTPLHCAAKHGHTRVLRFLLQHQASVNARDNNLNTPLHYACLMDRTDCAKALFDWGCAKDARDKDGLTSLAVAAQTGSKELVQLLCSHGANINSKTHDGTSPLVLACARGDLDIVNFFLQNGAKPDAGNDVGSRPLHAAVSGHNLSIVQGLIHEGVSIDAKGSNGWTPLHVAASQGQSSIASALLASGAGVNIKDDQGATALHFAAAKDDVGMIDILLAAGADPDLETIDLETSLHWAAAEGAVNSARRLLAQKAKPNQKNKVGQTPLHLSTGNREISSLLLGAGSDPSAQSTEFGYTPAHLAAFNGEKDVLELLLDNGADKEARGTKGPTPLLLAAQNGHLDCCELLLSRGAYLEAHDIWNATPLWIAAGHGQTEAVELLLKHGANVHAQNEDGMTPLCVACRDGYTGVVKLLLSRGAKVVQPGHSGLTPLDIAIVEERKDVVMELLSSAEPFAVGGLTLGLLARLKDPAALELGVSRLDDTDPNPELVALWPVALAEAASEGRSDRVETFLNHGVDTDSLFGESGSHKLMSFPVSDKTADVVESLLKRGVLQPNRQDNDGWNILHWASFFESPRTVEAVLRHADSTAITARTKAGRTALHGAARNEQSTSIAEALLQTPLGADVDCRDSDGCTPLHVAVATGTLAMTELLLDHGANPMAVTSRGASVLHLAFQNSDQEVPIYLLGLKMSEVINQRTRKGVAPLHVCASRGSRIALEMLLSIGAQADSVDGDEEDPLYYAVRSRNLETLYTLLEHGVQPDRPNKHGWTALHFAASSGSEWATVAEALLDVGASLTADNNGWFPIDIAAESSEGPMLELLRKRGGKNSKPLDWHYPIPSQWNVKDKSTELTLSDNNCVVELPETASQPDFTTQTETDEQGLSRIVSTNFESPGYSVRSDFCIPKDADEYSFECEILEEPGKAGYIAIGLALPTADLDSMVGWGPSTWGYHGDDGQVRNGEIPNRDYGPRFTTADVIGCYYRRMDLSIHFTKNGKYLGTAFTGVHGELYPMVSLIIPGSKVRCKFNLAPPTIPKVP